MDKNEIGKKIDLDFSALRPPPDIEALSELERQMMILNRTLCGRKALTSAIMTKVGSTPPDQSGVPMPVISFKAASGKNRDYVDVNLNLAELENSKVLCVVIPLLELLRDVEKNVISRIRDLIDMAVGGEGK